MRYCQSARILAPTRRRHTRRSAIALTHPAPPPDGPPAPARAVRAPPARRARATWIASTASRSGARVLPEPDLDRHLDHVGERQDPAEGLEPAREEHDRDVGAAQEVGGRASRAGSGRGRRGSRRRSSGAGTATRTTPRRRGRTTRGTPRRSRDRGELQVEDDRARPGTVGCHGRSSRSRPSRTSTAAHQAWWSTGRWRSTTTSPVVMRSAISVVAKRPSGMSSPWATKVNVSASVASKPPTTGRSA